MGRITAVVVILTVSLLGLVGYRVRQAYGTSPVTASDADVNKDGAVTIADAIAVLPHIGQLAPLPAAIPQIVGDRAFVRLPSGTAQLINTSIGAVVVAYPFAPLLSWRQGGPLSISCDGKYAALDQITAPDHAVEIVDVNTGAEVVISPRTSDSGTITGALFSCPTKAAGGAFAGDGPTTNRAVTWAEDRGTGNMAVTVWDLAGRVSIATDSGFDNGRSQPPVLDCSNSRVFYLVPSASSVSYYAWKIVRLSDGAIIATLDGVDPSMAPQTC